MRTGPFDHKAIKPENDEDAKAKALERYKAATGGKPERLVSGSDDFTMFMWTPATSKQPVNRMTGHVQLINHVLFLAGRPVGRVGEFPTRLSSCGTDTRARSWPP